MSKAIIWATDGSPHADTTREAAPKLGVCDDASIVVVHGEEYLIGPHTMGDTARVTEVPKEVVAHRLLHTSRCPVLAVPSAQ